MDAETEVGQPLPPAALEDAADEADGALPFACALGSISVAVRCAVSSFLVRRFVCVCVCETVSHWLRAREAVNCWWGKAERTRWREEEARSLFAHGGGLAAMATQPRGQ